MLSGDLYLVCDDLVGALVHLGLPACLGVPHRGPRLRAWEVKVMVGLPYVGVFTCSVLLTWRPEHFTPQALSSPSLRRQALDWMEFSSLRLSLAEGLMAGYPLKEIYPLSYVARYVWYNV